MHQKQPFCGGTCTRMPVAGAIKRKRLRQGIPPESFCYNVIKFLSCDLNIHCIDTFTSVLCFENHSVAFANVVA
jgi:hypothetical protein